MVRAVQRRVQRVGLVILDADVLGHVRCLHKELTFGIGNLPVLRRDPDCSEIVDDVAEELLESQEGSAIRKRGCQETPAPSRVQQSTCDENGYLSISVGIDRREYRRVYPDAGEGKRHNNVGQIWSFSHRIEKDHLIVLPLKTQSAIALGRVLGSYEYRNDLGDVHHALPVRWIRTDLPRGAFDQDLLFSFGAFMTVCQVTRNDAESRIRSVVDGPNREGPVPPRTSAPEDEGPVDIALVARDEIARYIERRFAGHDMARLVEAILRADGYETQTSTPGADGGVDVLAATGSLGFSPPRLVVQVKSQQSTPADVTVFRSLMGSMHTFGADRGLLVCWGGFKKSVLDEARTSFFKIRLWDSGALVDALLRAYERLPEQMQAELPLKRTWILVHEEE